MQRGWEAERPRPTSTPLPWLIGDSDIGVVVVVFTVWQPDNIYRIITARHAGRRERSRYDEAKNILL